MLCRDEHHVDRGAAFDWFQESIAHLDSLHYAFCTDFNGTFYDIAHGGTGMLVQTGMTVRLHGHGHHGDLWLVRLRQGERLIDHRCCRLQHDLGIGADSLMGLILCQDRLAIDAPCVGSRICHGGRTGGAERRVYSLGLTEVIAYTAADNLRSQAVMIRLQMQRDPSRDFTADYDRIPAWRGLVWVARQPDAGAEPGTL
jgi:hypothetical protein